jgi:hypothetical protein
MTALRNTFLIFPLAAPSLALAYTALFLRLPMTATACTADIAGAAGQLGLIAYGF